MDNLFPGNASGVIYSWQRRGRRPATLMALALLWGAAVLGWSVMGLAPVFVALLVLISLPVLLDVLRNPLSQIIVTPGRIAWTSALKSGQCDAIDHVRLDRRFDGGMRITILQTAGAHRRVPPDICPPTQELETALNAAGIAAQRHPFSPF